MKLTSDVPFRRASIHMSTCMYRAYQYIAVGASNQKHMYTITPCLHFNCKEWVLWWHISNSIHAQLLHYKLYVKGWPTQVVLYNYMYYSTTLFYYCYSTTTTLQLYFKGSTTQLLLCNNYSTTLFYYCYSTNTVFYNYSTTVFYNYSTTVLYNYSTTTKGMGEGFPEKVNKLSVTALGI